MSHCHNPNLYFIYQSSSCNKINFPTLCIIKPIHSGLESVYLELKCFNTLFFIWYGLQYVSWKINDCCNSKEIYRDKSLICHNANVLNFHSSLKYV